MFRKVCDPSSGSTELCLTEITLSGSRIFFVCLVGIWQRNFEPAVRVHGTTGWELVRPRVSLLCKYFIGTSHTHTHTHMLKAAGVTFVLITT